MDEHTERLARERSIRLNRRQKFINCISSDDVNMGTSLNLITIRA